MITDYIEELLDKHNDLRVPGLGVFSKKENNATFTELGLIAPCITLSFEESFCTNDGVLIRAIIKKLHCTYIEAAQLIATDITRLRKELSKSESIQWGNLGCFSLRNENVVFAESKQLTYNLPHFGLSVMTLAPLSVLKEKGETFTKSKEDDNKTEFTQFIKPSAFQKLATVAAAIIILLLAIPTPIHNNLPVHTNYAQLVDTKLFANFPNTSNPLLAEAITPQIEAADSIVTLGAFNTADTASLKEVEPEMPTPLNIAPKSGYAVIIASLPNQSTAYRQLAEFEKKGHSPLQIIEKGNKYRIAYCICSTNSEAYQMIEKLKKQHREFTSAWVLSIQE